MILDLSSGCPTVFVMCLAQPEVEHLKVTVGSHASRPKSQTLKLCSGFSIHILDGL